MMHQVFVDGAEPHRAEVRKPDADVPVRGTDQPFVEPSGFEQYSESHEQVGALYVWVSHEKFVLVEAVRYFKGHSPVVDAAVVNDPGCDHVQVLLHHSLFAPESPGVRRFSR